MNLATDKMLADVTEGVGWMTFNNPARRNAISDDMQSAMTQILGEFQKDPAVRVVVMTGAGDKAFVSGRDLSHFDKRRQGGGSSPDSSDDGAAAMNAAFDSLEKPLIAMIRGYCLGGGLGIALRSDLRIASDDAKFGIPTARLGNVYRRDMLVRVMNLIGAASTAEMIFTADYFNAEDALRVGLVNRVVPGDSLEETVRNFARKIAQNAPLTIRASKAILRELSKPPGDQDISHIKELERICFESADFEEGRLAFREKRKPAFSGR
jgi:enoyl-CoA hydratase/carnithine racemase